MARTRNLSLLGAALVTPALVANEQPASATIANTGPSAGIEARDVGAEAKLKSAILAIAPAERLDIAGDRVELISLTESDALAPGRPENLRAAGAMRVAASSRRTKTTQGCPPNSSKCSNTTRRYACY